MDKEAKRALFRRWNQLSPDMQKRWASISQTSPQEYTGLVQRSAAKGEGAATRGLSHAGALDESELLRNVRARESATPVSQRQVSERGARTEAMLDSGKGDARWDREGDIMDSYFNSATGDAAIGRQGLQNYGGLRSQVLKNTTEHELGERLALRNTETKAWQNRLLRSNGPNNLSTDISQHITAKPLAMEHASSINTPGGERFLQSQRALTGEGYQSSLMREYGLVNAEQAQRAARMSPGQDFRLTKRIHNEYLDRINNNDMVDAAFMDASRRRQVNFLNDRIRRQDQNVLDSMRTGEFTAFGR